ncbi:hypothetical protein ABQE57_05950 [Mycolicibacterium elephantis]
MSTQNQGPGGALGAGQPPPAIPPTSQHYDFTIEPVIASLSHDQLEHLRSSLHALIDKRIEGIHYAETRRSQLAAIGGALAPIGVALVPLALGTSIMPLRVGYLVLAGTLVILGAAVWWLFMRQTNYPYPWLAAVSNWKWFYHGALTRKTDFGPDRWAWHSKQARIDEAAAAGQQWDAFKDQAKGLANEKVDATQDLKQLYLLHINERYKNLFLTDMRKLLARGLLISGIAAVLAAGITAGVISCIIQPPPDNSVVVANGLESRASWSPTGSVRANGLSTRDVEYRVEVRVTNQSKTNTRVSSLVATDESGKAIPVEFLTSPAPQIDVPSAQTVTLIGHFWIASSDRESLREITAQ